MRLEGSCECGAVQFSVASETPYPYRICYCRRCRKAAGAVGAAVNILADAETLEVRGDVSPTRYEHETEPVITSFCPAAARRSSSRSSGGRSGSTRSLRPSIRPCRSLRTSSTCGRGSGRRGSRRSARSTIRASRRTRTSRSRNGTSGWGSRPSIEAPTGGFGAFSLVRLRLVSPSRTLGWSSGRREASSFRCCSRSPSTHERDVVPMALDRPGSGRRESFCTTALTRIAFDAGSAPSRRRGFPGL